MTRTQIDALKLHLMAIEIFLYRHRQEIETKELQRLNEQNTAMYKMLDGAEQERG